MRAAQIRSYDGPDAVELVDIAEPEPAPDQVLIEVQAAGVAFPEVLQTRGKYQFQPELPFVPGAEVAGTVASAPADSPFAPGDRVCAYPGMGGFAQLVAADVDRTMALPSAVSFESGSALPLNYLTTHFALTARGRLRAGESVVVRGAAGGIGTSMIQFAKALGASPVIGVVSTPQKADVARLAGADEVVVGDGLRDGVRSICPDGVDVVVDPVGGTEDFTDCLRSLAPTGRALVIGFAGGEIPTVKTNRLLLNNLDAVGVGWGAYALKRPGYLHQQWRQLLPLLESGALAPIIGPRFELRDVVEALRAVDERRAVGKVVLRMP